MTNRYDQTSDVGVMSDTIADLFNDVMARLGFPGDDRYMGEFPYPDKSGTPQLQEIVSFRDWQTRDRIATGVRQLISSHNVQDIVLKTEDENRDGYSHSLTIVAKARTITSTFNAYAKMLETLQEIDQGLENTGFTLPAVRAFPRQT